jgi:hypothetical protein
MSCPGTKGSANMLVMDDSFWIAALVIAVFACYVVAKVIAYMRKSERDWQRVDKSKLRTWDDEEE